VPAPPPPAEARILPELFDLSSTKLVDDSVRESSSPSLVPPLFPQHGTDLETPSVAPVALRRRMSTPGSFTPSQVGSRLPPHSGPSYAALWTILVVAISVLFGAVVLYMLPPGSLSRAKASARAFADRVASKKMPSAPPVVAPAPPALPSTDSPSSPSPSATSTSPPAIPVEDLPRPSVPPDMTLVSFPDYAQGHRIYVDGAILATGSSPTKLRCGRRNIRIGSAGKARDLDLPCGRELILR
jgi:hypothetical protein